MPREYSNLKSVVCKSSQAMSTRSLGQETSVVAVRMERPGSFVFIFIQTASFGWTRMTSSLRGMSLKIPLGTSLNWIRISVFCSFNAVISTAPKTRQMKKGRTNGGKGQRRKRRRLGTFSCFEDEWHSVPSLVFDEDGECGEGSASRTGRDRLIFQIPRLIAGADILSNNDILTLNRGNRPQHTDLHQYSHLVLSTFSSRMSSAPNDKGRSMATRVRTCNKWFCMTSRMIPISLK